EFNDYLAEVATQLRAAGVRVEIDDSDDRFPKKIRNASKSKVPFVLIAGGEDRDANAVSFRFRNGEQDNGVSVAEAVTRIVESIETKAQV
ncbi:MAG: His/Gly/Thr/Pro-type tRNA ligase C-terminal domain-containing protein, partial [Brevibacterium sp.]|nr:His/Gly/Thr/Pro-type tRNA ligase C-terminal domain-containing protein [Brevibacterium sp.]